MSAAGNGPTEDFFRFEFKRWPDWPGQTWQDLTRQTQSPLRPVLMYSRSRLKGTAQSWRSYLQSGLASVSGNSSITPRLRCLFSVKSQPELDVLRVLAESVDGFDVSSRQELELIANEFPQHFLSYSGPGKTADDLAFADQVADLIHLDSVEEVELARRGRASLRSPSAKAKLTVRLSLTADSKLGLSETEFNTVWETAEHLQTQLRGAHWYLGRESFSEISFEQAWNSARTPLERLAAHCKAGDGLELTIGLGLPSIGKSWPGLKLPTDLPVSAWNFEAGRCLVQDSAVYFAPIVAVKERSERVIIVEGGTQHLGGLLSPIYGSQGVRVQAIRDGDVINSDASSRVRTHVFGSLCLSHDRMGAPVELPRELRAGDWLGFTSVGAYNLTASAADFIGRPRPLLWMLP